MKVDVQVENEVFARLFSHLSYVLNFYPYALLSRVNLGRNSEFLNKII